MKFAKLAIICDVQRSSAERIWLSLVIVNALELKKAVVDQGYI